MVIFHSYVSLPEGNNFRSQNLVVTLGSMNNTKWKSNGVPKGENDLQMVGSPHRTVSLPEGNRHE